MERTSITVVDAPKFVLSETKTAGETLLKFYRELGWNGQDVLDPRKVLTTKDIFNNLYDAVFEKFSDTMGVSVLMANNGPKTNELVPQGKVHLLEGWTIPIETKED